MTDVSCPKFQKIKNEKMKCNEKNGNTKRRKTIWTEEKKINKREQKAPKEYLPRRLKKFFFCKAVEAKRRPDFQHPRIEKLEKYLLKKIKAFRVLLEAIGGFFKASV